MRSQASLRPSKIRVTTIGSTGSISEARIDRSSGQPASSMPRAGPRRVVGRAAQLRLAVGDPQPARRAVALVRQADAAGVDETHAADRAVVLLVGVAGHHEPARHARQRVRPARLGRDAA